MIDWLGLAHNTLWLLGLAMALAVLSIALDESRPAGHRLRDSLAAPGFQAALDAGLVLVCVGLLFSAQAWWERGAWGLAAVLFAAHAIWAGHRALAESRQRGAD